MNGTDVSKLIEKHRGKRGELISVLQDIQSMYGYLPEDALRMVAEATGRSLTEIYGMATFYRSFSLRPRGKHLVSACVGTACHVRGGPRVVEELKRELGIEPEETTADGEFTLETVNCLGACALGPIVVIDGHYFSDVNTAKVKGILNRARSGLDNVEIETDKRVFPIVVSCPRCNHSLMDPEHPIDHQPSIRVTVSFGREHGWLRLSSLYGSQAIESEYDIPMDTVVNFFCPFCHAELASAWNCPDCGAPMIPMVVRGGAIAQVCSRRGCKGHMLDLGSPDS
jgi:NADH:ubiquinone oxidoreductase subunit E